MMTALRRGKPDRLPVTIHQWQQYHLATYMNGVDQLDAFRAAGLDASVTPFETLSTAESPAWRTAIEDKGVRNGQRVRRYRVATPDGELTWEQATNEYTTFNTEHVIKHRADAEMFLKHMPAGKLDKKLLSKWYDRTGDSGIVRLQVAAFAQPGPWQEFCELAGTQQAIVWAMEEPEFVHFFLEEMTRYKINFVHHEMAGAKIDLVEHGGGAASGNVISPAMFDEFCAPYDRRIIGALHEAGFLVVYHTCGGMMAFLENIPANGCDASETCSPPGVGGDITTEKRPIVKKTLGSKVALIGGLDQSGILEQGTAAMVEQEVESLFTTLGKGGGYICSASDHFFQAPLENLKAMARAGSRCAY